MRYIALAMLALSTVHAEARVEKLLTPVQIVKDSTYCGTAQGLMYRERMEGDKRYDTLGELKTIDVFIDGPGKCGTLPAGKYLFFDGVHRDKKTNKVRFVCLRFRPYGDCVWTRPDAIGTVYEVYPGRSLDQGNRGVTCAQWAKAIGPAEAPARPGSSNLTLTPEQRADMFVGGMAKGLGNMFLGTRTQAQDTRSSLCANNVQSLQRLGLRLTAYNACPSLGAGGQEQEARRAYNVFLKEFINCLPK